jgi:hypothetical protein
MGVKYDCVGAKGQESYWRDYKAVRLQNLYYGGFFQDNLSLTNWVNTQRLTNPVFCLGDGHDGVWNLFEEIACADSRLEILDWYHLRENLYKVGGSIKRLKQAEAKLWQGQVDEAKALIFSLPPSTSSQLLCLSDKASSSNRQLSTLSGTTN